MPYLHWATSGARLDRRIALIRELADEFRDPLYKRPTAEEIEAKEDDTIKMKIMRAFLDPKKNDRCLHVRRTLDQYYYSTLTDADERTVSQVVYKFAKKQHCRKIQEAEKTKQEEKKRKAEWMDRTKWDKSELSLRSSRSRVDPEIEARVFGIQEAKQAEASWDPPKVMMVNQLWMWIIDGGRFYSVIPLPIK
jgi:hypothetical protein